MKANKTARKLQRARVWAGVAGLAILLSAQLLMAYRFGADCGTTGRQPESTGLFPPTIDLLAAR